MKKIFLFLLLAVFALFSFSEALAQSSSGQVNVSASVPSPVDPLKCEVIFSATEILADPSSHSILITVYIKDNLNNPVVNRQIKVVSNRGAVDIIEALTGPGIGTNETQSDINGMAQFRLSSFSSGEAEITVIADNVINLGPYKVTFLPLPFPANLTVVVPIPWLGKEIPIIVPPEQKLTLKQEEAKRLVNLGAKIAVPFWFSILIIFMFLIMPALVVFSLLLRIRKLHRMQEKQLSMLTEEESQLDGIDKIVRKDHQIIKDGHDHKES